MLCKYLARLPSRQLAFLEVSTSLHLETTYHKALCGARKQVYSIDRMWSIEHVEMNANNVKICN